MFVHIVSDLPFRHIYVRLNPTSNSAKQNIQDCYEEEVYVKSMTNFEFYHF